MAPPDTFLSDSGTADRILDAAEILFAEHGFEGTSLRQITAAARANLAAVNYHFGDKEALYVQAFTRRVRAINEKRLALFDEAEREAGSRPPSVARLLDCLLRPMLPILTNSKDSTSPHPLARLMARNLLNPPHFMQEKTRREFAPVMQRFSTALLRAAPHLSPQDLACRMPCMLGAVLFITARPPVVQLLPSSAATPLEAEILLKQMIAFCAAGLSAPTVSARPAKKSPARRTSKT